MIEVNQVKITTEGKAILLPDVGVTNDLASFRKQIIEKYQELITRHTNEYFNPRVLLIYEENERDTI